MTRPSKYTGDAPQAFEGVDAEFAVSCIDLCIKKMKENKEVGRNIKSMTVLRKTVATTMPGGHVIAEYADRVVLWLNKVRDCLVQLLCMRFSRIGDVVGAQVSGVPIGGPCSGILVCLIFSVLELYTDDVYWPALANNAKWSAKVKADPNRTVC